MKNTGHNRPRSSDSLDGGSVRDVAELFTAHLEFIRRAVRHTAARHGLWRQDVEDFEAEVLLKLIEDDYAVLRRFEGRSLLSTYLVAVIHRAFLDFQIKRQGKWRPSAAARRRGPDAVRLERLVRHEGRTLDEACEIFASTDGRTADRDTLAAILEELPDRPARRSVGAEALEAIAATDGEADRGLRDEERDAAARRTRPLLAEALRRLAAEDRLLVRLWFSDGLTIAAIAVTLGLRQRPLYRRMERCLKDMRRHLEARGLDAATVHALLERPHADIEVAGLEPRAGSGTETSLSGPSNQAEAVSERLRDD